MEKTCFSDKIDAHFAIPKASEDDHPKRLISPKIKFVRSASVCDTTQLPSTSARDRHRRTRDIPPVRESERERGDANRIHLARRSVLSSPPLSGEGRVRALACVRASGPR